MKRTIILLFAAGLFALWADVLLDTGRSSAQTSNRDRQVTAQPAATPTPKPPVIKEEDEIVRVETELVNLHVRVIDRFNRPIANLKQNEFKVFEDGVEQEIGFFSQSDVPTNYSIVVDNSGSLRMQIEQVIEAGKILVATNKPADETSIIRFISSDKIEILRDFTSKKTDLNEALDDLYIEGGQTAIIDAVYLAANRITEYEKSITSADRKRRALVLVSDGEDKTSYYTQKQLFDLLRETEVQIYVVGFLRELDDKKGFITKSAQGKAKDFLERLATETGGKAYFPADVGELNGIAKEIANELRTQYSIGYIPSNDRTDNTFRNIKVVVNDGPNKQKRIAVTRAGRLATEIVEPPKPTQKQ
ncbi:MAG: VWA domain-containing protein [Blastocatellia bacterium]